MNIGGKARRTVKLERVVCFFTVLNVTSSTYSIFLKNEALEALELCFLPFITHGFI